MRQFVLSGRPLSRSARALRPFLASLALALALALVAAGCGDDGGGGDGDTTDTATADDTAGGDATPDVDQPDTPGGDDTTTPDVSPAGPVVIVTEFMPDSCVVSDTDGEWIEVTNVTTNRTVDIDGWTLRDDGGDEHVIDNGGPLLVEPGMSLVLAANGDDTVNGGFTADYVYSGFTMRNSGADQIVLVDRAGEVVDAVAYDADWLADVDCAALQLSSDRYTAAENDAAEAWCAAAAPYGDGDNFGSPGGANAICVVDRCGDSVVDVDLGEECDLGPDNSNTAPDTCREDCTNPSCGDDVTDPGNDEACDDGEDNADDVPDACRTDCTLPSCGDGVTDPGQGEQCDDGPDGSEECTTECRLVGEPAPALPGDIVITEIMRNSADTSDIGEWVELHNPTAGLFSLEGCVLSADDGDSHTIEGALLVDAGGYVVLARSDDDAATGGLVSDYVYSSFRLGNTEDQVILTCFGTVIDEVRYSDAEGWPDDAAYSMSLAINAYGHVTNDDPGNWCSARDEDTYGDDTNHGTPGAENPACGELEPVDWCRLQGPATIDEAAGTEVTVYGRVREAGVTDATPGNDPDDALVAQVGYGPDTSDPDANVEWTWLAAAPNPDWDGTAAGETDNDEYRALLPAPAPGTYDYAYRFSADGGATWLYCDLDGSDNGYDVVQAGAMTTTESACFPNPCTEAPAADCAADGVTTRTYSAPGACTATGAETYECDYPVETFDCSLAGGTCAAGVCVGGARLPTAAGELVITELMRNAEGEDDGMEWFEVYNASTDWLALDQCELAEEGGSHMVAGDPVVAVAPGDYLVLAQNGDSATNGGIEPDYVYGLDLTLGNTSDTLTVTCGGVIIDAVAYDDAAAWPDPTGATMSLDPSATNDTENDDPTNWCAAYEPYGDGTNFGSPGAENAPCAGDDVIDWCRYQWPLTQDAPAGTTFTAYGRVYDEGITDLTTGVDPFDDLVGQAGYGPDGSDPSTDDTGWVWFDAAGNPGWDGAAAGEADNDEYQADVLTPGAGTYDLAFRFSLDGGATWTYCDGGDAGSSDGYAAANAGALVASASPCETTTCDTPDPDECQDATFLIDYQAPGTCDIVDDAPVCSYPSVLVDCTATGGTCQDGACVGGARAPAAGEVIFTEVMYDTGDPLGESDAEWFELTNLTDDDLALNGCTIVDLAANSVTIDTLILAANDTALFGRTDDDTLNGGFVPDVTFDFGLNNTDEVLTLTCAAGVIDAIAYDEGAGWPVAQQATIALDPGAYDATLNDDADNWCLGADRYFEGATEAEDHFGTPGAVNSACPVPDTTIDWCRFQHPLDTTELAGTRFFAYGRVYDEGITDQTTGVDAHPLLFAQAGYGPDGSVPDVDDTGWVWIDAVANPGWVGADDEINNDEYLADVQTPSPGTYDLAYRFSLDGGLTWTYCDGGDGSLDGYAAADAGNLVSEASPCDPNPCDAPAAPYCDDDGVTLVTESAPGGCTVEDMAAVCDYPAERYDCGLRGGTCVDGACVGEARAPAEGEVVITEIMYDTSPPLSETEAEWIELHNVTGEDLVFEGCTLSDAVPNTTALDTFVVPAGAAVVLARSADTGLNGGVDAIATFDFGLNNNGDDVVLQCGDVVVDTVAYGAGFPDVPRFAIALDPGSYDATANDAGANWCLAAEADVYFAGAAAAEEHYGTPGAPNPLCPVVDTEVDWCRLQFPLDETVPAGSSFTVFGRVYEAGVTDISTGVDAFEDLVGQVGYGPDASDPSVDDAGWTWFDAEGNPGWDGQAAGEADNDEYQATFDAPSAGTYDFAYRFSRDGGETWLYCDDGGEGSSNGYAPADAGNLVTEASPCDPNPCTEAPAAECDSDGVTRITYSAPGTCEVVGAAAVCDYPSETFDCSTTGGTCAAGECVGGAQAPAAGDLVVSEIMYDTSAPIDESAGEWIELYNASATALLLDGCTVIDGSAGTPVALDGLIVPVDGYLLLARSDVAADNGGLVPDATFGFGLNNSGGDTITITCAAGTIDAVDYGLATFPGQPRFALSLDPDAHDAASNDDGLNWCLAADEYFTGAVDGEQHYGTPGAANPDCPELDTVVDWCRYQWPLDVLGDEGAALPVYGRIWDEGLTDQSTGVDFARGLMAQGGIGPDGSDPSVDDTGWSWFDAAGTADWDGDAAGEPDNDEYEATIPALPAGTWDLAFRFSLDGGLTWLYCDGDTGVDGEDGAENGYQPANAGDLEVADDVCVPNPCDTPPDAICTSATTLETYTAPGSCTATGEDTFDCTYEPVAVDCADTGGTCEAGACVGGAVPPAVGDVIVTEIMYDTESPLSDGDAEWFELVNVSDQTVTLDGCVVEDGAEVSTTIVGLVLAPDDVALFVRSDVAATNGDLVPDHLFDAGLNNGGDDVVLLCDLTVIDAVTYDDGATFPNGRRIAVALDPGSYDDIANDDGANWCLARDRYYEGATAAEDHFGTPGAPNPACDSAVDWCRYQFPTELTDVTAGTPLTLYGRVYEFGITEVTDATDEHPVLWASAGFGPDGSDPSVDDTGWTWTPAVPNPGWDGPTNGEADNDEYQAEIAAPAPGTYDLAYRFSLDGGRSWLYCDDGGAGASDGYAPADAGSLTTIGGALEPLLFSEHVEGSVENKALEIYNAGAGPVLLSSCEVRIYSDGGTTASPTITLDAVELAAGDVFVLCHPNIAVGTPDDYCDQDGSLFYNGDDAIELNCQGTVMDVIGRIGEDPGSQWPTAAVNPDPLAVTQNQTIVRNCDVFEGDSNGADDFDPDLEWTALPVDDVSGLGSHCTE